MNFKYKLKNNFKNILKKRKEIQNRSKLRSRRLFGTKRIKKSIIESND